MQSSSITLVYIRVQKQRSVAARQLVRGKQVVSWEAQSHIQRTAVIHFWVIFVVRKMGPRIPWLFFLKQKWENKNCVIIIINILIITITYYIVDTKHIYKPNLASTNSHYKYWNIHSCDAVLSGTLKIKIFLELDSWGMPSNHPYKQSLTSSYEVIQYILIEDLLCSRLYFMKSSYSQTWEGS